MASSKIKLVQGDTKPPLIISLKDEAGDPIDVSNIADVVRMKFRQSGQSTVIETFTASKLQGYEKINGALTYDTPYNIAGRGGRIQVNWSDTSLDNAGEFEGEIEITFADGKIQTVYETLKFKIREQF